jgi:beta-alanine degradation protein BauB
MVCSTKNSLNTIDPVVASPDKFRILLENENVRVVEYVLKPGERDNWHTHPAKSSYVASGGSLRIHLDSGETVDVEERTGTASWMNEIGKHYAENVGNTEVRIVLTEVRNLQ